MCSHPVHCTEVHSFSKVEALVKSTVISSWKSDDKLASTLVGAIDLVLRKKKHYSSLIALIILY